RRLGMAPAARGTRERRGRRRHLLARVAVDAIARHPAEALHLCLAIKPVREKRAYHVVANGELIDALTHGNDLAGAVRHRDASLLRPGAALGHHVAVEVE